MQTTSLLEILSVLQADESEFILVGGVAAVLHGAPIQTYDLDLVYSRDPENIDRLLSALESLDAVFRLKPERRLKPNATHLAAAGHLNLLTRAGPLDLLATVGRDLKYEDLFPHSSEMEIGTVVPIRVLNLETIIALKEELRGPKDLAVLPILRQTLNVRRKESGN